MLPITAQHHSSQLEAQLKATQDEMVSLLSFILHLNFFFFSSLERERENLLLSTNMRLFFQVSQKADSENHAASLSAANLELTQKQESFLIHRHRFSFFISSLSLTIFLAIPLVFNPTGDTFQSI